MFERFTPEARTAIATAREAARTTDASSIGTHHILLGILGHPASVGARALHDLGISSEQVRDDVDARRNEDQGRFSREEADALQAFGIDIDEVRRAVEETFGPGALESEPGLHGAASRRGRLPFAAGSKKALELAVREAVHLGHGSIGTEHLLLGLVRDERSTAASILRERGADPAAVRAQVLRRIGDEDTPRTA